MERVVVNIINQEEGGFTSAQRLVWAAKQPVGKATLGALFAWQRALLAGGFGSLHTPGPWAFCADNVADS